MEEWKECTVGDICSKITSGGTPKSSNSSYYNGSIPWLNTKEVNFNRIFSTEKTITQDGYDNSSAKWIPENSVIVAMYGATAGRVAISKIDLTTNQACCNLIIDSSKADYQFVYYHLYNSYTHLSSLANGGAQQNLNANQIREYPIKLPPLPTQQKIAAILSSLDDKIELNNKINTNLEQQAQAIFEDFFPNVIDDDGLNKMEELITFSNGKKRPEESGIIPVFGGNGILAYTNKSNNENCCIIGRVGAYCGNVFLSQNKCWISDNAISAKSKDTDSQFFIFYLLKKANLQTRHIGSGQPLLTQGILNSISINIPQKQTIEQFNDLLKPIFDQIFNNSRQNENLVSIRDTLLPKLMNGEIEVNKVLL